MPETRLTARALGAGLAAALLLGGAACGNDADIDDEDVELDEPGAGEVEVED